MPIFIDPTALRAGWRHGTDAKDEAGEARKQVTAAAGSSMGDFRGCLSDAASDMDGVLQVVIAVLGEFGTNVETCITTYQTTDHHEAGSFNALTR